MTCACTCALHVPGALLAICISQELFSPRTKTAYSRPNSVREAARARDALATTLYEHVFDEVVVLVNAALNPAAGVREGGDIGLLDVFGFEVLHVHCHVLCMCIAMCTACALHVHCMCTAVCAACIGPLSAFDP